MLKGYMGRILRVDLTLSTVMVEEPPESIYRKYIGGVGLGGYFLRKETSGSTDPLGPENRLIFMTGPFTGTGIVSSGRHSVVAKSPLTGIWGEADVGGHWGLALKGAGYDGMIVQGSSAHPVCIYIDADSVKIEEAADCWGKDTYETEEILKARYGTDVQVQTIGRQENAR